MNQSKTKSPKLVSDVSMKTLQDQEHLMEEVHHQVLVSWTGEKVKSHLRMELQDNKTKFESDY